MLKILLILFFLLYSVSVSCQWISQTSGTLRHLYGMDVVDSNVIYCSAQQGENIKTTNSGINWHQLATPFIDNFNSCSFLNSNTGIFAGPSNTIIMTTNGGVNFSIIYTGLSDIGEVRYVNQNWVYSCGIGIGRSTNGGVNWQSISGIIYGLQSLYFTDTLTGTVVGINGYIVTTTNGGVNWTQRYMMLPVQFGDSSLGTVQYINSTTGFISGNNGIVVKTTNKGVNWIYLPTGTITSLNSHYFVDENTGYIVGTAGKIFKTTNSGLNWFQQNTGITDPLTDIEFINLNTGWVCGFNGRIMKTTNGGSTWINPINSEIPTDFYLYQNYPNPFNPNTNIKFSIKESGLISLKIYDNLGKEISTLVNGKLDRGVYEVNWDGTNFPSGIYYSVLKTESRMFSNKMILLK